MPNLLPEETLFALFKNLALISMRGFKPTLFFQIYNYGTVWEGGISGPLKYIPRPDLARGSSREKGTSGLCLVTFLLYP